MIKKQPHAYRDLSKDEMENLFSQFLIDSWSYSKVGSFSRNEKSFEMQYIYRNPTRRSSSAIAGSAYHEALDFYFSKRKEKEDVDIIKLEQIAFDFIDDVKANDWKIQKTTPTIEECKINASKVVSLLIKNFFEDISVYNDEIKEILGVELYCNEFLVINGVDIPLPCHLKIDLVVKTNDNKIAIIDHKSKRSFSKEDDLRFTMGQQAITYAIGYEAFSSIEVDEVWIIENKYSKNRDKSPQLSCFKVVLDKSTRRLYEAILYEPLKRMLEAISDPDYVYLINDNDNFVDKAELYEFWSKTMIAEIDEFPIPESKRDLISKRLKKIRDASLASVDPKTIKKFRENAADFIQYDLTNKNMTKEEKIEHVLRTMGINVNVAHKFNGYSSDTFLIEVSAGTNISSLRRYKLNIASALNVSNIRMMDDLFVYEGKSYLAIESSKKRDEDLMFDSKYLNGMRIPLGLDNFKQEVVWDLDNHSTPHALICGATGSGKSVQIISILEYAILAGINEVVILDPKHEFTKYNSKSNISVYNDIDDIEEKMRDLVIDMNSRVKTGKKSKVLVIFDEFADAVASSKRGKALDIKEMIQVGEYAQKKGDIGKPIPKMKLQTVGTNESLEGNLKILLQKGRSLGFRIVAATQRASTKVITGDAKVNFPVQICFRVPKEIDSRVVIDEPGAECLAGRGDGLINSPEYLGVVRFQAFYKS